MAKAKKKPSTVYRFMVDGEDYELNLDVDKLPIRERIDIEEYLGMPFLEAAASGWLESNKAMAVFAWIAMRRRKPKTTLDDILESETLTVEQVDEKRPTKTRGTSGSRS